MIQTTDRAVLNLSEALAPQEHGVVSRVLLKKPSGSITCSHSTRART
jgi:hypothetical protein